MSDLKNAMAAILRDEFPQLNATEGQAVAERILNLMWAVPETLLNPGETMDTPLKAWTGTLQSDEMRSVMINDLRANYGVNQNRAASIADRIVEALLNIDQATLSYGETMGGTAARRWNRMIEMALL